LSGVGFNSVIVVRLNLDGLGGLTGGKGFVYRILMSGLRRDVFYVLFCVNFGGEEEGKGKERRRSKKQRDVVGF
jgi:hypothetical protein